MQQKTEAAEDDERLSSTIPSSGPKSSKYVTSKVCLPDPDDCPPLVLLIGPCRVGTTALFLSLSKVSKAYYQPLKSILRTGLGELEIEPSLKPISIKETLGPFHPAECSLDPLSILLEAGYPMEKLSLVSMFRHPFDTYRSWEESFLDVNPSLFINAYQSAEKVTRQGKSLGVKTSVFLYESLGISPSMVLERLFSQLPLTFDSSILRWKEKDPACDVVMDPNPGYRTKELEAKFEEKIFGKVTKHGGIKFQAGKGQSPIPKSGSSEICEALSVYDRMREEHIASLGRETLPSPLALVTD